MNYLQGIFLTFSLLTFEFLIVSCSGSNCKKNFTGIPPEILEKADQFIILKTGDEFFNKYIKPDEPVSTRLASGYLLIYKFHIPEKPFVEGLIRFTLDEEGKVLPEYEISGIPGCVNSPIDCSFNINKLTAINIAKQYGLESGIKEWDVKFLWNAQFEKYVWYVITTLKESEGGHGKRASGKEMIIDSGNGEILTVNDWRVN